VGIDDPDALWQVLELVGRFPRYNVRCEETLKKRVEYRTVGGKGRHCMYKCVYARHIEYLDLISDENLYFNKIQ
jgi:hypothetical protein